MLLLKKKKYAAISIKETDGGLIYEKEMKGLDLVRRDWYYMILYIILLYYMKLYYGYL